MIKINRVPPPINTVLDSQKNRRLENIEASINNNSFTSKCIYGLWKDKTVKNFLYKAQHGKCCYCERKRDSRESDVEHFRPKSEVKGCPDHKGYWWLSYEWINLLISCKKCNQDHKNTNFPLEDESKRAFKKTDNLNLENPLLINPLEEEPDKFIEYDTIEDGAKDKMIKAIGKNERGNKTIELTGINSEQVMMERIAKWQHLKLIALSIKKIPNLIKTRPNLIKDNTSNSAPFSGFALFFFRKEGLIQ